MSDENEQYTLTSEPIIVLDTETSGLDPLQGAHVLTIGAVMVHRGQIIGDGYYGLGNPGDEAMRWASPKALEINKLTRDEISAAPPTDDIANAFHAWNDGFCQLVTAYNVAFDSKFLKRYPWKITPEDRELFWPFCIMLRATDHLSAKGVVPKHEYYGRAKWVKLAQSAAHYGIDWDTVGMAHNALADAKMAALVLIELEKDGVVVPERGA